MCQKCRPRCPKGEVELAPCTPHSDRQCGPPPTSTFHSLPTHMIVTIVVIVVVILLVLFFCFWKFYCHQSSGDGRDLGRKSCSVVDYMVRRLTRYRSGGLGTQDNILNERFIQDQLLPRTPAVGTPSAPGSEVMVPYPAAKPRRKLVPVQGKDPCNVLRRCFEVFAQEVPHKDWKRYGRALELGENDIAMAEMNDRYSLEPCFQMLTMWQNRQGMNASVNTLLDTLHEINLGGIAEDISFKLVQRGSYQYEVS
uniref:Tumor necrosis factor receptor superfamily, member 10b n=1 Tax=Hypotaenidia okinawae TaxID=2861861 RepID=A0A6G1RQP3_9GRUI